jgi:hypothetical protein
MNYQPGDRGLPGVFQLGREGECPASAHTRKCDPVFGEGLLDIKATTLAKIVVKEMKNLGEKASALPEEVTTITSLVGRIGGRHVVPGGPGGELPKNTFEDKALVYSRATTG